MSERRALGPRRLVEVDRPLLHRNEHRDAGQQLRDRRPAQLYIVRPVHPDLRGRDGHSGNRGSRAPLVDHSQRIHGGRYYGDGTAPRPPADAYAQAQRCLEIIVEALATVDAEPAHVVRTRVYLVNADDWEGVGRAHGEVFSGARPATAFVVVSGLLDPRWLVEIEADALLPE